MFKIQNFKQDKTFELRSNNQNSKQDPKQDKMLEFSNGERVLNLEFSALNLFGIWCFEFVIF